LIKGNWGRGIRICDQFFEILSINSLLIVQKSNFYEKELSESTDERYLSIYTILIKLAEFLGNYFIFHERKRIFLNVLSSKVLSNMIYKYDGFIEM
jgi:hypothetical protein